MIGSTGRTDPKVELNIAAIGWNDEMGTDVKCSDADAHRLSGRDEQEEQGGKMKKHHPGESRNQAGISPIEPVGLICYQCIPRRLMRSAAVDFAMMPWR